MSDRQTDRWLNDQLIASSPANHNDYLRAEASDGQTDRATDRQTDSMWTDRQTE